MQPEKMNALGLTGVMLVGPLVKTVLMIETANVVRQSD